MYFSAPLTSLLYILPSIVAAHSDIPGAPRLFGHHTVSELRSRNHLASKVHRSVPHDHHHKVIKRQESETCGPGVGSCAAGLCCSAAGHCGTGPDYCAAPDCLINYGPACDANATPPGASTSSVPRTKLGSVLYGGAGVYDCVVSSKDNSRIETPF
jgi:hypothetical protein